MGYLDMVTGCAVWQNFPTVSVGIGKDGEIKIVAVGGNTQVCGTREETERLILAVESPKLMSNWRNDNYIS